MAGQTGDDKKEYVLASVARTWASAGDIAAALNVVDSIPDEAYKNQARRNVADGQANAGDIAGAQKTAGQIQNLSWKTGAQIDIAKGQMKAGDIAGAKSTLADAKRTANLLQESFEIETEIAIAQSELVNGQVKAGDIAGAGKTADQIQVPGLKKKADIAIAEAQAKASSTSGQASTTSPTTVTQAFVQPGIPVITTSSWLDKLDEKSIYDDCPLNTEPFLDFASYLKSLKPSDSPSDTFGTLQNSADIVIKAQHVIDRMLKQQGAK